MYDPAWLNVGCGTHNAPFPWWNIDVVENGNTRPNEVVPRGLLPYPEGTFERVYLGHVIEHIDWGKPVLAFLRDVHRILRPGGEVAVVGPDAYKTLEEWRQGREPWTLVASVLEHATCRNDLDGDWPEARHHWNCTEARVVMVLEAVGFEGVLPWDVESLASATEWPIVAPSRWQCAAIARKPILDKQASPVV